MPLPIFLAIVIFVHLFGFVVFFGAPYLPSLGRQAHSALDLLDLKPGQTLLELGCGDGTVVRLAAARGLYVVGYELNPILALTTYATTFKYRKQVIIVWGNYWKKPWPKADGIYTFLLPKYMVKLDKKIATYDSRPLKLASVAFSIADRKVSKEKDGVFLYTYK